MNDDDKPAADAIADALIEAHGIDPRASLALRSRFELALADAGPVAAGPALLARLASRLRVGETRFYRDPEQLDAIAADFLPNALAGGRVRALSAGCSTGEEAWTLGAMLEEARGDRPASWEVVAIDAQADSVTRAREGAYPEAAIRLLPRKLARFFTVRDGLARPTAALSARCRFSVGDLLGASLGGPYQLILCRNVLIYLEEPAARRLLDRLAAQLAPGGLLFVARAEVQLARRAGLAPIELGASRTLAFGRPPRASLPPPSSAASVVAPPASAPSTRALPSPVARPIAPVNAREEPPPPSRVCFEVDRAHIDEIVARGLRLLAAGAPIIELRVSPRLPLAELRALEAPLRRLLAAGTALGARCVAADDASQRTLAALGLALGRR